MNKRNLSVKTRIFNVLARPNSKTTPGRTSKEIARMARTSLDNVRKRVYELRQDGHKILSNYNTSTGKTYYRLGA